jgi:hypothetical protein
MSGRSRVVLADGRAVRSYRKTLRKNPRRPLVVIRNASPLATDLPPDAPSAHVGRAVGLPVCEVRRGANRMEGNSSRGLRPRNCARVRPSAVPS